MSSGLQIFLNGVAGVFSVVFILYLCIKLTSKVAEKFEVGS